MSLFQRRLLSSLMVAGWLGLVTTGFAFWEQYDKTPGPSAEPVRFVHSASDRWELVLFLHPRCPCSRASLTELSKLVEPAGQSLAIRIVFVRPDDAPEGWENSELWAMASAIPGVHLSCENDSEAKCAGATTSGHAVLTDPTGRVAFSGGITRGRGQEGESVGLQAILELLGGSEPPLRQAPVFGCALFSPEACNEKRKGNSCRQ